MILCGRTEVPIFALSCFCLFPVKKRGLPYGDGVKFRCSSIGVNPSGLYENDHKQISR